MCVDNAWLVLTNPSLICLQFLPKYSNQTTAALGEGEKLASWHLQLIGVSPELQRKGIGSALIDVISNKVGHGKVCTMSSLLKCLAVPFYCAG